MKTWIKRFHNPRRLACCSCPERAAQALAGVLELTERTLADQEDAAAALVGFLLEWGLADRAVVLRGPAERRRVAARSLISGDLDFAPDHGVLEYVLDRAVAVGANRKDDEGVWPTACVPLIGPGRRPNGCLFLERLPGNPAYEIADLDLLQVLARALVATVGRLPLRAGGDEATRVPQRVRLHGARLTGSSRTTRRRQIRQGPRRKVRTASPTAGTERFRVETVTTLGVPSPGARSPRRTPARPTSRERVRSACQRIPLTLEVLFEGKPPLVPDFDA